MTVPVTTYVIVLPAGIETLVSSMLPEPLAEKPVAPPVVVAVQVSPVKSPGIGSAMVTPVALAGPVLLTTTV